MLKTLKRKIALVAVAGLGFGVISTVPAFAAAANGTATILTDSSGAGSGDIAAATRTLYVGAPYVYKVADADTAAGATLTSIAHAAPLTATSAIGTITAGTGFRATGTFLATATSGTITVSYTEDGAVADTVTLATATIVAAPAFTATVGPARVNSGQTIDVKVTGTSTLESDTVFKYANISKPTGATDLALTDTLGADVDLSAATTATKVGTFVAPTAAGTYTGVVYQDTNGNGTVDPGEPSSYVSITTAGAPASATLTPATDTEAAGSAGEFTVTLKDAAGNTTQAAVGEFFSISADPAGATSNATIAGAGLASISNPGTGAGAASTAVVPFTALGDGTEAFTVAGSAAGDTVAIAVASSGALRAQGVAASLTATLTTVGASSAVGTATAATNVRLAATTTNAVTAAETVLGVNPYLADPSLKSVTFEISGLDPNKSIAWDITATDANNSMNALMTVGINGADAAAYTSGTDTTAVADATGKITLVWSTTGTLTADADIIVLDVNGDGANAAATKRQTNARVDWVTPKFALALTAPTTTTLLVTKTSTVTFSGTLKDQFNNPLQGAVLNLAGVQTGTAVAANLTATTTSAADGTWSLTMAAPAATTTSVSATVTAVRTGATFIAAVATGQNPSVAYTINYTTTGDATTLTHVASPAQTLATDGVTIATIPATITPHDGVVTITAAAGLSDASYTIATAATAALATDTNTGLDEYFTIVPTSTPAAEVTFTSDDSVWFSAAAANVAAVTASSSVFNKTGKFASGSTVKIWSTKAGRHTVTMSVGATTKTQDFWTSADATSGRNIAVAVPASVKQGEIGRVTITVTDNWGNPVKGVAASTITAAVTGQGTLGGGKITDTFGATDAAGQAILAFQAGNADGTLEFTITAASTNYQFSSLAGRAGYVAAHTTDGTLTGLTKSVISAAQKTAVTGSAAAAASNPEVAAVKADVKAVSDTVATLSKAVTTIQSSVTELTSSFSAQIKSLSAAIAKISKAIAALSKKIK